jgi:methylase of polypeptide subunit release factors
MGAGETTAEACRAAYPRDPIGHALDLGCGAGAIALLFARTSQKVYGTDINVLEIVT